MFKLFKSEKISCSKVSKEPEITKIEENQLRIEKTIKNQENNKTKN
jgi:hypothetical protein